MTESSSPNPSVMVLFFAAARQKTGQSQASYSFTSPYSLGDLKHQLFEDFPDLHPLNPYLRWAVNQSFVDDDHTLLSNRDEVAVIPPISGG